MAASKLQPASSSKPNQIFFLSFPGNRIALQSREPLRREEVLQVLCLMLLEACARHGSAELNDLHLSRRITQDDAFRPH